MQIIIHKCQNIWFILLDKQTQYFMILFYMYLTKCQKLQTSAHTDAAPDARLFSNFVKFSKRGVILILSKTHFRY